MEITKESLEKWKEYMQLKKWAEGTKDTYYIYANLMYGQNINQENINSQLKERGNNYPSFVKNFLNCFEITGIKIVKQTGRKKRKQIVDHFTEDEMDKIIESISEKRLLIMIRLMFEDGLRISEVLNLKKKNFDMVNRLVKGKGKGNEYFSMPIYDKTFIELGMYLRDFENNDYIFRWDGIVHQRIKAWYIIKKTISKILPYKMKSEIYPHVFRHSCGTYLREKGFDLLEIQKVLRHKHLETVSHYTAVDDKMLKTKLRRLFE